MSYPPKADADRKDKLNARRMRNSRGLGLGLTHSPLPYNNISMNARSHDPETEVKRPYGDFREDSDNFRLEVETLKLPSNDTSMASSFNTSGTSRRYIKRYRNEEEKLLDIIHEREALIKSAISQGQTLRAKCNRYKEELDSLKAMSDIDMTDLDWKRKYNELDQRNRDLKEEIDILSARNNNGRDQLQHQSEVIELLNNQLQHEKIEKHRLLSNSLNSLHSVGVKDKKGKLKITQLEVDNKLLQERLNELTVRNQRGREYLTKLESERRDQDEIIDKLKSQLLKEKQEKENLMAKVNILASQQNLFNGDTQPKDDEPMALYAQVQKKKPPKESRPHMEDKTNYNQYETVFSHTDTDTKSMGFDVEDKPDRPRQNHSNASKERKVLTDDGKTRGRNNLRHSEAYEDVRIVEDVPRSDDEDSDVSRKDKASKDDRDEDPYITTYGYNSAGPSGMSSRTEDDLVINDPEPTWDHVTVTEEINVHNEVTSRF